MATTVRASDSIDVLDLPMRAYGALKRNNVREVGELVDLTEREFLSMRGVGVSSLEETKAALARHGLAMRSTPLPPPDPTQVAEAEWIGRQLDALCEDERVVKDEGLWARDKDTDVNERRRLAWAFYRWGIEGMEDWPKDKAGGRRWMAYAMPGSLELHLEGLNRLAHEELGA